MEKVHVDLGPRSYDIEIGSDNLKDVAKFCDAEQDDAHAVIITDTNVDELYSEPIGDALQEAGAQVDILVAEAGEQSKAPEVAADLWEQMLDQGADRKTVVIALGGGVVGDLAGFVAATYTRGLRFVQVPTTLLAQVDSSVGGKVGVNLPGGKNLVGAFWQPRGVIIDVSVLDSLPEREFKAGLAEVVKYGAIFDAAFLDWLHERSAALLARDRDALLEAIERSCRHKAAIVEQDPLEHGDRALLNFGHTFAHAIEAEQDYGRADTDAFNHGEAVAIGMVLAARLSAHLGMAAAVDAQKLKRLLDGFGLPTALPRSLDADALIERMRIDKKAHAGGLRFVLWEMPGRAKIVSDVPADAVLETLRER